MRSKSNESKEAYQRSFDSFVNLGQGDGGLAFDKIPRTLVTSVMS